MAWQDYDNGAMAEYTVEIKYSHVIKPTRDITLRSIGLLPTSNRVTKHFDLISSSVKPLVGILQVVMSSAVPQAHTPDPIKKPVAGLANSTPNTAPKTFIFCFSPSLKNWSALGVNAETLARNRGVTAGLQTPVLDHRALKEPLSLANSPTPLDRILTPALTPPTLRAATTRTATGARNLDSTSKTCSHHHRTG